MPLADELDQIRIEIREIREILQGTNGELGIAAQVRIMWRMHVWLLCTLSAILGSLLTLGITRLAGHLFP